MSENLNSDAESPTSVSSSLWSRPAGIAEVLRIALPLMISTGCLTLTLFSDRTLLLWYGESEMAASMAAGNLFWTLVCFPIGIVSMTSALVAQYAGSGQREKVGRLVWQSVWLSLAVSPALWMLIPLAETIFSSSGQTATLIPLETVYLQWLLVGATAAVLESALSGFFSGTERTRIVMWVNIAASILNLVLDVVLIFGYLGFSELGIVGAGIASTVSYWFKTIIYILLMHRRSDCETYGIRSGRTIDIRILRKLLFFGLPAGLQYLAESGSFAVIILQIGQVGTEALAATAMAINFNMAAFVPLIGVSIAASILVGKHLTESGPELAQRGAISAVILAVAYSACWALAYVLVPDFLLSLYALGEPAESSIAAAATARILLRFVAAYCVFDAIQIVLGGALRGAGDTWFVLGASLSVALAWIAIGLVGESWVDDQLFWWWWMVAGWIASMATSMIARFVYGKWKLLRMVEGVA